MIPRSPSSTLFPYTTLFRSVALETALAAPRTGRRCRSDQRGHGSSRHHRVQPGHRGPPPRAGQRSEEHTSELQSRENLVCRLLLEKKNIKLSFIFIIDTVTY